MLIILASQVVDDVKIGRFGLSNELADEPGWFVDAWPCHAHNRPKQAKDPCMLLFS